MRAPLRDWAGLCEHVHGQRVSRHSTSGLSSPGLADRRSASFWSLQNALRDRLAFALACCTLFVSSAGGCGSPAATADGGRNTADSGTVSSSAGKPGVVESETQTIIAPARESTRSSAQPTAPQKRSQAESTTPTAAAAKTVASETKSENKSGRPERIKDLTFDDIKFEMNKEDPFERSMLTPKIEKLDGKPIRIRGYILPTSVFSQKGFTNFVLVRDNQECCFGPGASLYDAIIVRMEPGKTADFNIFPVAVEGIFSIKELKGPGGRHLAIYEMVASSVK